MTTNELIEEILSMGARRAKAEIEKLISEVEKAFGGCRNCYGKGYATQESAIIGHPDFIGDKGFKKYEHKMIFCNCNRGKQLKAELEKQL